MTPFLNFKANNELSLGDTSTTSSLLMQPPRSKASAAETLVAIRHVLLAAFVIAILFFARDVLIPLALAALLTFLLSPVVGRIERWIGRIAAVLLTATMMFIMMGVGGWVLTRQLVDLATRLPDYKVNIKTKLQSFQVPSGGVFRRLSETVEELKRELAASPPVRSSERAEAVVAVPAGAKPVLPVQVVEPSSANPLELVQMVIWPLVGPLGIAGLVILLVIFMLLKREDLRSRLIRLLGQGRIGATSRAMEDTGRRVSRYLLMQLAVNMSYGIAVAVGLFFIGLPNAILWGTFAAVLRYIPYIGPWIGATAPIVISLAISPNWMMPLLTIALFVSLELISANFMEPWLYGASTGVSSVALIVAAVFWTWLWGPIGLVLSTPLTVCLVVMGRHVPRLAFFSILLSDEQPLTPAEECYHRLLSGGLNEASELADSYLKTNPPSALYDSVFIPVITAAEIDHDRAALDDAQLDAVEQGIRDIVEELGSRPAAASDSLAEPAGIGPVGLQVSQSIHGVCCVPARAQRDEIAATMLTQLLRTQGIEAYSATARLNAAELIKLVDEVSADAVCISVVSPSTIIHARYLCAKLRAQLPDLKIVVGLWGATENLSQAVQRLRDSGANEVVTTLADAVGQLIQFLGPGAVSADEDRREHVS
jgi:predicted PurR-regulated permease PerM/methylmalonyl-CoA mutase cobalamin-binding subunit